MTMSLLPAALRIARGRGMAFPAGVESFGMRACRPDFTSSRGFRWPFPGRWAEASGPFGDHDAPCPIADGDGLCVAHTWDGMASGGCPAHLVLLVGWHARDVLGSNEGKSRVKRVFVIDALTVGALLAERKQGEGADLRGADLRRADLYGANLCGADLYGADLDDLRRRGALV